MSDLRDILRALDDNVSEEELDEMISEIDADGSGTVDFDGEPRIQLKWLFLRNTLDIYFQSSWR